MIKLRIEIKNEDKFSLLLKLIKDSFATAYYNSAICEIKGLNIDDKEYLYFIVEYNHTKFINFILNKIEDIADIMEIHIAFAFVYNMQEAYKDIDTFSNSSIRYNQLTQGK